MLVARERFDYDVPLQHVSRQPKLKRVRRFRTKTKVVYSAIVLIALCLAFMITSRYAQIVSMGYDIESMRKQAKTLELENQALQNRITELKSLDYIERVATTKLGMQKPEQAAGVQFVPVEYSKAGLKTGVSGVASNDGKAPNPAAKEKKNFLVQALASIING